MELKNLLLIVCLGVTTASSAQNRAGIRFVAIPFAPDAVAWTEAGAASGGFAYAAFSNPSVIGFSTQNEVLVSQNIWPGQYTTSFAGAALKQKNGSFGFSILSNLIDDIEARTTPGAPDGTFSARYTAVSGTLAKRFGWLSLGISGSLLNESIYEANASGWSMAAGMSAQFFDDKVKVGSALLHYGKMSPLRSVRSELPARWQTGIWTDAVQVSESQTGIFAMLLSLKADIIVPVENPDANQWPNDTDPYLALGYEMQLDQQFYLRGGWRSASTTQPWSAGLGVKLGQIRADYAFTRQQTGFGTVHSIGLSYLFK